MTTYKPSEADCARLKIASQLIKQGNAALAKGKKDADTGKAIITQWLADNRQCNVSNLAIGELVNIEAVAIVEIGAQTRLDQQAMQLELPETFAKYQRQFPTIKFKPLV